MEGRLPSTTLGLELGKHKGDLCLYDPTTQQWLQPPEERAEQAEAKLAEALAELECLRSKL